MGTLQYAVLLGSKKSPKKKEPPSRIIFPIDYAYQAAIMVHACDFTARPRFLEVEGLGLQRGVLH